MDIAWSFIILAYVINFIAIITIALKNKFIVESLGSRLSLKDSSYVYFVSQFLSFISPGKIAGILSKPVLNNHYSGMGMRNSVIALFFEQIFELAWQFLLFVLLLLFFGSDIFIGGTNKLLFILVALFLLLFLLIFNKARIFRLLKKRAPKKLKRFIKAKIIKEGDFKSLIDDTIGLFSNLTLMLKLSAVTFVQLFLSPLIILLSVKAINLDISYLTAIFAFWFSYILGKFSGIPAGLGVRDISLGVYLKVAGLSIKEIAIIALIYRIISMSLPVVVGLILSIMLGKEKLHEKIKKASG